MSPKRVFGFAAAVSLVTAGVLLHVPDVAMLIHVGAMPGMAMWTPRMLGGMALLLTGVLAAGAVLFSGSTLPKSDAVVSLDAIEHGRLRPIYWATCAALTVALVIDIMKPLTLGFVMPGMSEEYGIPLQSAAALPLVALTGTAVGSVVWGLLADRYGRRPAFLLATVLFIATSACGAMPSFSWNLAMCFAMGASAGGLLPLVFTLIAELAPRRHRGWLAVSIGGIGGLGGYLAASTAAHYIEPAFTWRSLWLIGLPTGLLLLCLTPLIPESPLFLLRHGHRARAEGILDRYGSRLGEVDPAAPEPESRGGVGALVRRHPAMTAVIGTVGFAWGVVNFGFLVMLPANLQTAGMTTGVASGLLARSALYSAPALLLVVVLYAAWSGRRSLILFMFAIALGLGGVALSTLLGSGELTLLLSVGILVLALSAVNAMLLPYTAEIYPTALRATGSGFAAAATKVGGVIGPLAMMVALRFSAGSGLRTIALSAAVLAGASVLAALLMLRYGTEVTRSGMVRASAPSARRSQS